MFLEFLYWFNWFILGYFILLNGFYFLLLIISSFAVARYNKEFVVTKGVRLPITFVKPFSILVPAYNEASVIVEALRSFLSLDFEEYEVIVCNDGSKDNTLQVLMDEFALVPVEGAIKYRFPCKPIKTVYFSKTHSRLVVLDKENGGKADAQNAGANIARYPYMGAVDSDSLLSFDSMRKLMARFSASPETVGVGGIVRISNGSRIENGHVVDVRLPTSLLENIQVVEYLRAFLYGRMGWSHLNILMIISGAFGVFRQDVLARVGGWNSKALGEDIDVVLKIHRLIHENKLPMRLSFAPDPVCWTQAPADLKDLGVQRDRWQRGLMQTLFLNIRLFFNPRYKQIGMLGYPYFFLFEMLGGVFEFISYPIIFACFFFGIVNLSFFVLFMSVALIWGLCISYMSVALEEVSYRRYSKKGDIFKLFAAGFFENFGYRQIHSWWRVRGFFKYIFGINSGWGTIQRAQFKKRTVIQENPIS